MLGLQRRRLLLGFGARALPGRLAAGADTIPTGRRIAFDAYDPVAYFTDFQPQKGSEAFWFAFDDAVYLFQERRPSRAVHGRSRALCSAICGLRRGGVSKGYKTEPDPEAWAILNGKLYLFEFKDRVPAFKQDAAFIDKANSNWPGLKDGPLIGSGNARHPRKRGGVVGLFGGEGGGLC